MTPVEEKKIAAARALARAERLGRFRNAALASAVIGFGLQLAGTVTGQLPLAQVGMGMFLFGLPLFFFALWLGRRGQPPSPPVEPPQRPASRSRRKRR